MRSALIVSVAILIIGCAGPSAIVEDRTVPGTDRPKASVWRAAVEDRVVPKTGGTKVSQARKQAPAQPFCDAKASSLIHPVHFNPENRRGRCPLLSWEIHTVREAP